MNIDERLERLVERHEALTQTVEHLAMQGEEQNKRIQAQGANIDKILLALEKDGENIRGLAHIAEIHEHRISELEGGDNGG
jgi:tagatose-1,6-bisphosphate aldolase